MSRTTDKEIKENPCKKFLKWKTVKETIKVGEDDQEVDVIKGGAWVWYDKSTKLDVVVNLPLSFAVLNKDLTAFKGYDEGKKRGVWSNEVSEGYHIVTIQTKGEKLLSFPKSEYKLQALKDKVKGLGAKYVNSVYIAVSVEGEWEIWNLQIGGAAFSGAPENFLKQTDEEKKDGWSNFLSNSRSKLLSNMVDVKTYKTKKKGTSKFTIPVFTLGEEIDTETGLIFDAMDKELQEYLDYYFAKPAVEIKKEEDEEEPAEVDELDY